MNSRLGLPLFGVLAAVGILVAGSAAAAVDAPPRSEAARIMSGAPGTGRLSNADERRFDVLMADHRTTRGRLPADQRRDLDQLTARVRDALFPTGSEGPGKGAWDSALKAVGAILPGLSGNETASFAGYALDGIAAGDIEVLRFAKTDPSFTILAAFKPQYMQLQPQMKNATRSYNAISAILKTKHDTVKNSISNVR